MTAMHSITPIIRTGAYSILRDVSRAALETARLGILRGPVGIGKTFALRQIADELSQGGDVVFLVEAPSDKSKAVRRLYQATLFDIGACGHGGADPFDVFTGYMLRSYRTVLARIAGVTTSNDLDQAGFEAVMGFADYCGFRPLGKGAPRYGNRPGMATFAQIELIRELWRELHDQATCDDDALTGWLLKYHTVSSFRFLTLDAARKAITALKAWKTQPKSRAA